MSFFCINHLLDYELDYELAIRSVITQRNVSEKRKILSKLIKKERSANKPGSQVDLDNYNYNFKFEEAAINKSITSITDAIIDFEGTTSDSAYARIQSRIIHLSDRVKRLVVPGDDEDSVEGFKQESYATCIQLESDLDDRVTVDPQTPTNIPFPPQMTQPVVNVSPVISCSSSKQPLSTWGVKFNGDAKSVYYFLERVSDLSRARGVSEDELFISAVELFVGDAFIWYRSVRSSVTDWNSLVARLKKDFLPPYSDDEVWDSIRQRKQKKNESFTIFIAQLENLFSRLTVPVAEVTKVKYVKRNLLPEYIHQLALHPVDSISTLTNLCRNLEEAAYITAKRPAQHQVSYLENPVSSPHISRTKNVNFRNSSRQGNYSRRPNNAHSQPAEVMEADTSKIKPDTFNSKQTASKGQVICFNCRLPNHNFRSCTLKRNLFCFRCGEQNVKVSTCPKCAKN